MISLRPDLLARYRDIALLLVRHARPGLSPDGSPVEPGAADAAFDDGPERLAADLERSGSTFVKLGQLLSTRPDFLPRPYLEALARLQDDVQPFPFEEVERIVTEELGVRISKAFARFDARPFAAASLTQVHRAALRDGAEVVVKVLRPGIREQAALDLEALEGVAKLLDRHSDTARRYQLLQIMDEFRGTLLRELDLRREAANLRSFRAALQGFPRIRIPAPHDDYSSSRVLTMDYVAGTKIDEVNPVVRTDVDGRELADELFRSYLHQVLVVGAFHADPHPGNVLLTHDGNIALLDLGMVGHVTPDLQHELLRLLLAASEGRGGDVADIALAIAQRRRDCEDEAFRAEVARLVALHADSKVADLQVGNLLIELCRSAAEHGVLLPATLSIMAKTLLNLDQIAVTLDPDFDPQESLRSHVHELMTARMKREATSANLMSTLLEAKDFATHLPARAGKILELVADNKLRLDVDVFDEDRMIRSVEKVANRITAGLVLAALILGASLLMRIETPFTLFGYPGLAIVLFLAAAAGGFWLVIDVLRHDRRADR